MQKFRPVLLKVWREACRHIEIVQSTETIARMLGGEMPVDLILVRRIDRQRGCLETVATGLAGSGRPMPEARSQVPATLPGPC